MGFFSRRSPATVNDPNAATTAASAQTDARRSHDVGRHSHDDTGLSHDSHHHAEKTHGTRTHRTPFDKESGYYNHRPSFGQWLKMTWLDIITMVIMGAIGLGVYEAHPAPSRSFPVSFQDGEVVYPEFAYPLRHEIVPIWEAALLGSLVPIAVILLMQIRIRSFWDTNNAIIGLLYSLICAAVFQVFVKWLIGGLRPHFLTVCKPNIPLGAPETGNGFRQIMYDRKICTGDPDQIDDSLESMPSGHSTAAWAGFFFLYLYLNAKLKVWSNYHPAMWKLVAAYAPLLGATLITGALTIDEYHNWYDCLAGAVIGTVMAFSAYRMVYASVWDFRFNHVPLTRHTPFSYGAGSPNAGGFHTAVFTRKAGWGHDEGAFGGAPFDAGFGMSGGAGGMIGGHGHGHNDGTGVATGYGHGDHGHGNGHGHETGGGIFNHGNRNGNGTAVAGDGLNGHQHESGGGIFTRGNHHANDTTVGGNGTGLTGHHHNTSLGSTGHSIERRPVPPTKDALRNSDNIV